MLIVAIVFFTLAILFGLILLALVLQDKRVPRALSLSHGIFAVIGVVLLLIYAFTHLSYPLTAIILFIIAALGGLTLFYKDLKGQSLPKALALGHGLLAFTAFIALIIFTLTSFT